MYPVVLCARLVAAAHAHRQAQWQVGHGFLGLPNGRDTKTAKPGERGHWHTLSLGVHGDVQPATRGSVRYGDVLRMERQRSGLDGPLVRTGC